jgi:hypothetical protein
MEGDLISKKDLDRFLDDYRKVCEKHGMYIASMEPCGCSVEEFTENWTIEEEVNELLNCTIHEI